MLKNEKAKNSVEKTCPVCSKIFVVVRQYRNQKTCSRSCGGSWPYHKDNLNVNVNLENARRNGIKSASSQSMNRRSKNEIHFFNLIKTEFADAMSNEPMFDGWDADVIIPSLKIAIHWDGPWHWKQISKKQSLKQVQNRDQIKRKIIEEHGYCNYVIKDDSKKSSSCEFVEKEFEKFMMIHKL